MVLRIALIFSLVLTLGAGIGIIFVPKPTPSQTPGVAQDIRKEPPASPEEPPLLTPAVETGEIMRSKPTNFGALGTLSFDGMQPYLLLRGQRIELQLDGMSVCGTGSGGIPCMAMSVTLNTPYDGKAATIEGEQVGNAVLVRKMQVVENIATADVPAMGNVYIPWMGARRLLMACEARMAVQTHDGDVTLTLNSGEKVRATQPVLDEIFRVLDEGAREACPSLAVATE